MKKFLLFAAAMTAGLTVNAQELVTFNSDNSYVADFNESNPAWTETTDDKNKKHSGVNLTAESTTVGDNDAFTVTIGPDLWKLGSNNALIINGSTEVTKGSLQGDTNPKWSSAFNVSSDELESAAPGSGAFINIQAKKDGYIYVMHKASSNKSYIVYEEGLAIPYEFIALSNKDKLASPYYYSIKGHSVDLGDGTSATYVTTSDYPEGIKWPEILVGASDGSAEQKIGASGTGVIKFQVYAGSNYIVTAQGSKITTTAIYFDQTGNAAFAEKKGDGTITYLTDANRTDGQPSVWPSSTVDGINAVTISGNNVEVNANAPIYNLAGQQVTKAYKGIVLQNGHKFFNVK